MAQISVNYLKKYIQGAVIDLDLFSQMEEAVLRGNNFIEVSDEKMLTLNEKLREHLQYEYRLNAYCALNGQGMDYEKRGNIDGAIELYEKSIKIGFPAHHSFKRLMVIYRRKKDIENELRVINTALKVFPGFEEYLKRQVACNKIKSNTNF